MAGYVLLEGGAEFGGLMAAPDRRAIELAGGFAMPICIIPTAAAPDNNHQRAGNNGMAWFRHLGATRVEALPLIDKTSANDPAIVAAISASRLVYLLGGFTGYLGETLANSASWQAMLAAYEVGAVIAGSSAGAMVLCQYYYDPSRRRVVDGLNLVPNACVLPHHNTFGKGWAQQLSALLPGVVLLGIDERTGMLDDEGTERKTGWRVYGQGDVSVYRAGKSALYHSGESFKDNFLSPP
ncbi:MAG TPA: Type 1 glutamine amidotransferase-like domain-containing protein [Ktedonobacteraceae bacterium]|nr:Type 1 glutamine amidotransferase-like domain-containing protein [Ktedonobacteraceae bacterium]